MKNPAPWPVFALAAIALVAGAATASADVPMASAPLPPPPKSQTAAPAPAAAEKPAIRFDTPAAKSAAESRPRDNPQTGAAPAPSPPAAEPAHSSAQPAHARLAHRRHRPDIRFGRAAPTTAKAAHPEPGPKAEKTTVEAAKSAEHAATRHPQPAPAEVRHAARRAPAPPKIEAAQKSAPQKPPEHTAAAAPQPAPIDRVIAETLKAGKKPLSRTEQKPPPAAAPSEHPLRAESAPPGAPATPQFEPWHRVERPFAQSPEHRRATAAEPRGERQDRGPPPYAGGPGWRGRGLPDEAQPYPPPPYPNEAAIEARHFRRPGPAMPMPSPYPAPRSAAAYPPPARFPWPW